MPQSVSARVTVTVEIPVNSCWNPSTQMDQIVSQAKTDAKGILNSLYENNRIRVVGDMKVTAVLASE